jgi:hypothetical protein
MGLSLLFDYQNIYLFDACLDFLMKSVKIRFDFLMK